MSDISTEDFLAHYGVQGMHWGQRKRDVRDAIEKKKSSANRFKDERSIKTLRLGKAANIATIGALGTVVLGVLDPEPVSKGALLISSLLLTTGSITLSRLEEKSAEDDLLEKYGKK